MFESMVKRFRSMLVRAGFNSSMFKFVSEDWSSCKKRFVLECFRFNMLDFILECSKHNLLKVSWVVQCCRKNFMVSMLLLVTMKKFRMMVVQPMASKNLID